MKTRPSKKINVLTLGCSKNLYDSEELMKQISANHFIIEHNQPIGNAPIVIINTCGFIQSAKEESIATILECVEAKKKGVVKKIYVSGCLSQRYKSELEKEIPEVDAFFGTNEIQRILKTLNADYKQELVGERMLTTPSHYAYFKISEGCDRPCSFCAIPLIRGQHRSFPIELLIERAHTLAQQGVKELLIIAQDTTYYGLDLYGKRKIASLLEQLASIQKFEWIRLHYAYPSGFPEDLLKVMAEHDNICKYLDIPLQHISDKILTSMRRGITRNKIYKLIERIKKDLPSITLRTTFITGYPDETDKDFEELLQFVKDVQFDRVGVFTYSHEENTAAYTLHDNVPPAVKQQRAEELMKAQQAISLSKNKEKVGNTMKVVIDMIEKDTLICRSEQDSPEVDNEVLVTVSSPHPYQTGDFIHVKITDAEPYDLWAIPL